MKKISFSFKGRKLNIDAKKCGFFGKAFGLMFTSKENANALLFEFKKPIKLKIHSFFVFFSFIAVWFNKKGKVLEMKKIKPFTVAVSSKKNFYKLLEIPINNKYRKAAKQLLHSPVGD